MFLLIGDNPPLAIFGVLVFALGITGFWPSMNAYVLTLFPDESMAGDFGALGAIYLGIGSIGPSYVGFVAERTTYHLAFIGLVLCLIVSVGINLRISRL